MKLYSNSFSEGDAIPGSFAFAVIGNPITLSSNQNPHLAWSHAPLATKSFALSVIDPDVPSVGDDVNTAGKTVAASLARVDFCHWLLANLPAELNEIAAGSFSNAITVRGKKAAGLFDSIQGINDYTGWFASDAEMSGQYHGYDGPCPPWNDERMHHYVFTLYALDVEKLDLPAHFTHAQFMAAIAPHTLATASLTGRYTLNPSVAY
ncbi:MAG TPA: YbhB/YbcL family Raf kinase inhibitor-like protein [Arenimonas sp.]|nr:YbhB/YbcL family Raf kinase inhibitor-like protein [Arenimonas sp.]